MYDEATVTVLEERITELEFELQTYRDVVIEVCELLGHEGDRPVDLQDAVGQLERLLDGKDLDAEGLVGLAARLREVKVSQG